jgi:hypothetical protein
MIRVWPHLKIWLSAGSLNQYMYEKKFIRNKTKSENEKKVKKEKNKKYI